MTNLKSFLLIFAATFMLFSSCKQQIAYTKEMEKQYNLSDDELRNLQYHLVGDIVLTKSSSLGNTQLSNGEIQVNESQNMDKVIFREGTKGIFVRKVGSDKIAISFETSDDYFLEFGSTTERGVYKLQANSWSESGQGKITYAGEEYIASKASAQCYVTVKIKKSNKYNSSQRIAKGRKL